MTRRLTHFRARGHVLCGARVIDLHHGWRSTRRVTEVTCPNCRARWLAIEQTEGTRAAAQLLASCALAVHLGGGDPAIIESLYRAIDRFEREYGWGRHARPSEG